jgi:hypothetical protein
MRKLSSLSLKKFVGVFQFNFPFLYSLISLLSFLPYTRFNSNLPTLNFILNLTRLFIFSLPLFSTLPSSLLFIFYSINDVKSKSIYYLSYIDFALFLFSSEFKFISHSNSYFISLPGFR